MTTRNKKKEKREEKGEGADVRAAVFKVGHRKRRANDLINPLMPMKYALGVSCQSHQLKPLLITSC